jgi:hypothetical protein
MASRLDGKVVIVIMTTGWPHKQHCQVTSRALPPERLYYMTNRWH